MGDVFVALSINSKIFHFDNPNIFKLLTSKELVDIRNSIRGEYGTIIVGANTIKNDNPTLLNLNKNNIRIVIDKYGDLNLKSKIFCESPELTNVILLTENMDYEKKLRRKGVNVIKVLGKDENTIINKIKEISIGKILIEGGSNTISMFLNNKFIRNIKIIQFPFLLSSNDLDLCNGINKVVNCTLINNSIISNKYVYQCYKVDYENGFK